MTSPSKGQLPKPILAHTLHIRLESTLPWHRYDGGCPPPIHSLNRQNIQGSLYCLLDSPGIWAVRTPCRFLSHFQHGILPSSFIEQLGLQGLEDTGGYFCLMYFKSGCPAEAMHINSVLDSRLSQRAPLYLGGDEKAHSRASALR